MNEMTAYDRYNKSRRTEGDQFLKKIVKVIKHSSAQIIFGQFQLLYYIKVAKFDKQDKNRSN